MPEPTDRVTPSAKDATPIDTVELTTSNAHLSHSDYTVAEAMEEIARQIPDHIAIESGAECITYAELAARANQLAHALLDRELDHDTPVLLLCDHGMEPPVAMCGLLHAGLIAAPVDVKEPADRLRRVLDVSGAQVVLTDRAHAGLARSVSDNVLVLGELATGTDETPRVAIAVDHPGLILFTSGSTGTPKGVWLRHRSIVPRAMRGRGSELVGDERLALTASWGFTGAQTELFRAVFNGLRLCVYDLRTRGARGLPAWIRSSQVTELNLQPNVLRSFADTTAPRTMACLRTLSFGSETLYASDVRAAWPLVGPDTTLRNSLSSTEAGGVAAWHLPHGVELPEGPVPVGTPRTGVTVQLVDDDGELVPDGEPGRIVVIRNGHIAGGYWRDPEHTAACFFREPDGRQGFRTSDRGRWRDDGMLEHLGRLDSRVKVRGAMVATSEVETALMSLDGVADAAVIAVPDERTGSRLIAYVAPDGSAPLSAWKLRRDVATRVPTTMVPSTFVALDTLPRTVRHKLDRAALPEPPQFEPPPYREPTGHQAHVAALFAEILGVDRVGLDDDFFDLGGDSLGAIELQEGIAEQFGIDLPTSTLLEAPTVATLSARLLHRRPGRASPVVPLRTGPGGVPFFCVTGAGAPALSLRALTDGIDDRDVYAIQARGLEERAFPDRSIEAAARRYLREIRALQPTGPYTLGGYSFGGLVAFEMATRLRAAGEDVALLVLLDTTAPRGSRLARRARARGDVIRKGAPSGGMERVAVLGIRSAKFAAGSAYEHAGRRLAIATAGWIPRRGDAQYDVFFRLQAAQIPRYAPKDRLDCPLLVIRTQDDEGDLGWSQLTSGTVTIAEVRAEHLDLLRTPAVEQVGRLVRDALG